MTENKGLKAILEIGNEGKKMGIGPLFFVTETNNSAEIYWRVGLTMPGDIAHMGV